VKADREPRQPEGAAPREARHALQHPPDDRWQDQDRRRQHRRGVAANAATLGDREADEAHECRERQRIAHRQRGDVGDVERSRARGEPARAVDQHRGAGGGEQRRGDEHAAPRQAVQREPAVRRTPALEEDQHQPQTRRRRMRVERWRHPCDGREIVRPEGEDDRRRERQDPPVRVSVRHRRIEPHRSREGLDESDIDGYTQARTARRTGACRPSA
jgi:hypothetical protein